MYFSWKYKHIHALHLSPVLRSFLTGGAGDAAAVGGGGEVEGEHAGQGGVVELIVEAAGEELLHDLLPRGRQQGGSRVVMALRAAVSHHVVHLKCEKG